MMPAIQIRSGLFSMQTFQGIYFSLKFPDDWEHEIIEDVPCFFFEDGAGVLQIAATISNSGHFDLAAEMKAYLERNQIAFEPDRIARYQTPGGLQAMACEFKKDGRFWLVQLLGARDRMLVVIYNADEVPDQDLARTISSMIGSIEITA